MGPRLLVSVLLAIAAASTLHGQTTTRATVRALVDQAAKAEAAFRFDVAAASLYEAVIEHPRDADAIDGRLPLARLLALTGQNAAAILQTQALLDALPSDHVDRRAALDLAAVLARRLRLAGGGAYFPTLGLASVRGVTSLDEPTAIHFVRADDYLLVDEGAKRTYRIGRDAAAMQIGISTDENGAAAFLPDGTAMVAGKNGVSIGAGKPVVFSGTWGGRPRPVRKVRSLAALSGGDVVAIERDFEGLLLCKAGAGTCAPWGPTGKFRSVKVGHSDFVYVLDDSKRAVRALDRTGRQVAAAGPTIGTVKFGDVVDIGVDHAYGVYLLDRETRRIELLALRAAADNTLSLVALGSTPIPTDGERALRDASAIGIAPGGGALLAGRSAARFLTLQ